MSLIASKDTFIPADGGAVTLHSGAGKVLSGLVRRIDKDIACESVGSPEQVENLIERL